jgi:DNA-directed RNA polymerase specialized sigma24 family protein
VLQEAVLKAYRDFGEYRPGTNFRAWIFPYVTLEIRSVNRARAELQNRSRSISMRSPGYCPARTPGSIPE